MINFDDSYSEIPSRDRIARKKQKDRAYKILFKNVKRLIKKNPEITDNEIMGKVIKEGDPSIKVVQAKQIAFQIRQQRNSENSDVENIN